MKISSVPETAKLVLFALAVLFSVDFLVFRTHFFDSFIPMDSSTGSVIFRMEQLRRLKPEAKRRIAVLGDSRMKEGFSAREFDGLASASQLKAVNLTVPGSRLRVWYYLLKAVDPDKDLFGSVVIPMNAFSDHDDVVDMSNEVSDLPFLSPLVGLPDIWEVASSFSDPGRAVHAALSGALKLYAYRTCIKDAFLHFRERRRTSSDRISEIERSEYDYAGHPGSLEGLFVEDEQIFGWPDSTDQNIRSELEKFVFVPHFPQNGKRLAYNKLWLNRIASYYAGTRTRIVLVRIPPNPLKPYYQPPVIKASVPELARLDHVTVLPENLLDALQTPKYYFDALHVNRSGRHLMTGILASALIQTAAEKKTLLPFGIVPLSGWRDDDWTEPALKFFVSQPFRKIRLALNINKEVWAKAAWKKYQIDISVDGKNLSPAVFTNPGKHVITLALPDKPCDVRLESRNPFVPAEIGMGPDERILGFEIFEIKLLEDH